MDSNKIIKLLKIILIIAMVIFLFTLLTYKTNPCAICKFNIEGEEMKIKDFLSVYSDECFAEKGIEDLIKSNESFIK